MSILPSAFVEAVLIGIAVSLPSARTMKMPPTTASAMAIAILGMPIKAILKVFVASCHSANDHLVTAIDVVRVISVRIILRLADLGELLLDACFIHPNPSPNVHRFADLRDM